MAKNGLIIGLGNDLRGSAGFACRVLDRLAREPFGASVQLYYPGDDPRCVGGPIYGADLVVVVGALPLGGPAGRLHVWSLSVFRRHMAWMIDEYLEVRFLAEAMARADLAGGLPENVCFLWMEAPGAKRPVTTDPAPKAVRKTARAVKEILVDHGFLPSWALAVIPIRRLDSLQAAP